MQTKSKGLASFVLASAIGILGCSAKYSAGISLVEDKKGNKVGYIEFESYDRKPHEREIFNQKTGDNFCIRIESSFLGYKVGISKDIFNRGFNEVTVDKYEKHKMYLSVRNKE
ncbi:hypothetical protein HYV50_02345 [Candidatus Pacearchaeota archaeon]|nr:hypothetical protein [Candidatus Pacearchaeota archaeon]